MTYAKAGYGYASQLEFMGSKQEINSMTPADKMISLA